MKKIKILFLFLSCLLLLTCAVSEERHYIRKGVIKSGLPQRAFLQEFGKPDRTYAMTSGAVYAKGQVPMDVWVYESQNIELAFCDGRLAGWRTVEEARQGRRFRFWTPAR